MADSLCISHFVIFVFHLKYVAHTYIIVHTNYTLLVQGGPSMMWVLKFGHSEKRTKFEKFFHWNLMLLMPCPFTGPKMFCAGPNF